MAMHESDLKTDVADVVPHRPPMLLIDSVVDFNAEEKRVSVRARTGAESPFYDGIGVPGWAAIEYMAQAAATLAGLSDRASAPCKKPRPGLLLGTRRLSLHVDRFDVGKNYLISAACTLEDSDAAVFQCEMADADGRVAASASLNAYRPPDMHAFLAERAQW